MSSSNENISWTNEDVQSLMDELEYALSLMSPYYSQCNAGESAYKLLSDLKKKQDLIGPYFANLKFNSFCPICNKDFSKSAKGKLMSDEQQYQIAIQHFSAAHGITDYNERKKLFVKPYFKVVEFKNKQEYLDSIPSL
jgi:hypothetical protein